MLISPKKLSDIWKIAPNGVIHIGAHEAEEQNQYVELNWGHMYWVEANPRLSKHLEESLNPKLNTVINCAAWDVDKKIMTFNETTDTQSSSLLRLKKHSDYYPEIRSKAEYQVEARRIDCLFEKSGDFTFANIDIQGAELQAIRGMGIILKSLDAIYSEVNRQELYENCANIGEIDEYLRKFKFKRVATRWVIGRGWGDALYINTERVEESIRTRILNLAIATPFYFRQILSIILRNTGLLPLAKRTRGSLWHK
jgi:FkbM family methyltransferase